jgi:hypothetical protein
MFYSQISCNLIAVLCVTCASKYTEEAFRKHLLVGYMGHPCTSLVVFNSLVFKTGSYKLYITITTTTTTIISSTTEYNQLRLFSRMSIPSDQLWKPNLLKAYTHTTHP